ncbi:MAG TPA: GNAT family N-acetyltransferase [Ignavibacteriales bacterium]|nr:GNAT family N-acetyltransferase [Ignavibacteriales bacterium]
MEIIQINNKHREPLFQIIDKIELFNSEEKECAKELIDIAINNPSNEDYHINVLLDKNNIVGYYCCGQRPLTAHTWDLYWIVVDKDKQRQGFGQILLKDAENYIKKHNGKILLIETSSQKIYHPTVKFYLKNNYQIAARIKDFYKDNDDLIIFSKYLID